jgi:hypothetical protein
MRYPNATWRPGPAEKQGYPGAGVRTGKGAVLHSMEGSLAGGLGELDKPERRASWAFSNPKVGPLLQHYEAEAVTWHGGGIQANTQFIGIEHEGMAGQPLTENQIVNVVGLLRWLAEVEAWPGFVRFLTLWEHRDMTRFGSAPTACPSGRIPWERIIGDLEVPMSKILTPEEALKFNAQVAYHLNDSRDLGKIATIVQYIYRAKGWPWPTA